MVETDRFVVPQRGSVERGLHSNDLVTVVQDGSRELGPHGATVVVLGGI